MVVSPYIIAFAVGWAMAQCGKYVVAAIKMRTLKVFDHLYISGNKTESAVVCLVWH